MAGLKVFDTNAIIAVSQGAKVLDPEQVRVAISIITKIELLAWPSLSSGGRADLREMLASVEVIDIRTNGWLKLPDAIIAATAISLQAPLVTNDLYFQRVPGLVLETI